MGKQLRCYPTAYPASLAVRTTSVFRIKTNDASRRLDSCSRPTDNDRGNSPRLAKNRHRNLGCVFFGLSLVIVGGPLSTRLEDLSVGKEGLKLTLQTNPLSGQMQDTLEDFAAFRNMVTNSTEKQLHLIGKLQTQVSRMAKELGEIAATVDISRMI